MRLVDETLFDFRFALRTFRRSPGFVVTAFTTLVVGIAAVASIFSLMNAVYFAALPYKDSDRLVAFSQRELRGNGNGNFSAVSLDAVRLLRGSAGSFERVAAYQQDYVTLLRGSEPLSIIVLHVDTAFIPLFDLRPEVGRLIAPEEIVANADVAMISDQLWRTQFGSDPAAIGQRITLRGHALDIVGVMPPAFRFPYQTDVILPLSSVLESGVMTTDAEFSAVGKLRNGVSRDRARAEVRLIAARVTQPKDEPGVRHIPLVMRDEPVVRNTNQLLPLPAVFLGAGLFVLLIACGNVANLFLVRAAERSGEMAIRASLGAGRGRLIRQTLVETLCVGVAAAATGTALSGVLLRLGLHFVPTTGFPSWFHIAVDLRVLTFAVGITGLVTLAVGLAPAREGTRFDLVRALKRGGDHGVASGGTARSSRRALAIQLAMSVALFVSAALLVRSYQRLSHVDLGYPADRIAVVMPLFDSDRFPAPSQRLSFAEQMVAQAAQLPGVTAAAVRGPGQLRSDVPPQGRRDIRQIQDNRLIPDGDTTRAVAVRPFPNTLVVSDAFFAMLGMRVRHGRNFGPSDATGAADVTVISAGVAKSLWGDANPVGRTIQRGARGARATVIGVVDDIGQLRGGKNGYDSRPMPTLYYSTRQSEVYYPAILATGTGDVLTLRKRIVDQVRVAEPAMILLRDETLASQFAEAFLVTRVFGGLIGIFAIAGLALSVIGIYGVVAFGVARRTREIGIRLALGGTVRDIMRVIVVDAMRFVGLGLGIGLLVAVGLGRVIRVFLFGVSPLDPVAYAAVCVIFGTVALAACYWPARRVTRVDPLIALRAE